MLEKKKEEERDEPMNDSEREKLIRSGKQLLSTIYQDEDIKRDDLEKGKSYLFKEKKPEMGFRVSLEMMKEEGKGYFLSRMNPRKVKERYQVSDESISFYWLTTLNGKNRFDPADLSLISHSMIDFLEGESGPIFMEGVESILKQNSFSRFLGILDHLVDVVDVEEGILVVSLDPKTLSEQRLAQIERKLKTL
ncbi:MAG: DUF835 domain-containing protein [Thermoplasmata archaeon]